jgi:hypothetical protein
MGHQASWIEHQLMMRQENLIVNLMTDVFMGLGPEQGMLFRVVEPGGPTSCVFWATLEVIHKWDENKEECKLCCLMLLLFVLRLVVSFHL